MSIESKTITIDVPETRLAEFYAWYARFLAAPERRGRRGRHQGHSERHHGCRAHRGDAPAGDEGSPAARA